jgi:hypothetical protein
MLNQTVRTIATGRLQLTTTPVRISLATPRTCLNGVYIQGDAGNSTDAIIVADSSANCALGTGFVIYATGNPIFIPIENVDQLWFRANSSAMDMWFMIV